MPIKTEISRCVRGASEFFRGDSSAICIQLVNNFFKLRFCRIWLDKSAVRMENPSRHTRVLRGNQRHKRLQTPRMLMNDLRIILQIKLF